VKKVRFNLSSFRETRWHEYIVRFVFGGLCTVIAGLIAKRFGPGIGGLFLAFPTIFPASATMIESHEKRRKAEISANGTTRGRLVASIDASGAVLGCVGLGLFALIVWKALPHGNAYGVIAIAVLSWASLSYLLWALRKG
jgi:Protein of unknown function (DUF3147)